MKTPIALAAALSTTIFAGAATAGTVSYTGNYQVSLTHDVYLTSQGYTGHGPNTTHCLALTDDGSVGWPNSGYAVLDNDLNTSGQFAVIDHTIIIYVYTIGSGQEPASLTFSTTARDGIIGQKGAFDEIQGGTSYDADKATFGAKGSC